MRKAIVEPVLGQIKEQCGFRREWKLVRAASRLLKLFRVGWAPETA